MKTTDLKKLRNVIEMRVLDLYKSTRRCDVICIERSADPLDQRVGAVERETAVQYLEANSARLQEARAALTRIADGTYGICEECEDTISQARLAALPWAALCIRCQKEQDCRCGAKNARPVLALAA